MKEQYQDAVIKILTFIVDFWLIELAFTFTRELGVTIGGSGGREVTSFFLIFSLTWIIAGLFFNIYRVDTISLIRNISLKLLATFAVHILLVFTVLRIFDVYSVQTKFIVCLYLIAAALIISSRILYKLIWKHFEFSGFDKRRVVIVGATGSGQALYEFFEAHQESGYEFKGFFDERPKDNFFKKVIVGKLDAIKRFCTQENIDEIYFTLPLTHRKLLQDLLKFADDNFIYFRIAPDFGKVIQGKCNLSLMNSVPVLTARKEPLRISTTLKRAFKIVFSRNVIRTLYPLILPIRTLSVMLDSPGPNIFKQLRPEEKNRLTDYCRSRTIRINNCTKSKETKSDICIAKLGTFVCKTNLVGLREFFNVLLGNVSVVGPRPPTATTLTT